MKIRAIALNTFAGFLRNKLLILFLAIFLCVLLLLLTPFMLARAAGAHGAAQTLSPVLGLVGVLMTLLSRFGSLMAAWCAAAAVAEEMKSGTILAVLARPVRRWQYLLGKYLGVLLLMSLYVLLILLC